MTTKTSETQNDWEKEFNSKYNFKHYLSQAKFVTLMGEDMEEKLGTWDVEDLNKLLADARREVIEKVEKGFNRYRSDKYKTDSLALSYKRWVMLKNSIIKDDHI